MRLSAKLRLSISITLFLLFGGAVVMLSFPALISQHTMYLEKTEEIPDIKQTDRRLGFPGRGRDFCAPVVVLDAFMHLQKHGYYRIFEKAGGNAEFPVEACRILAELMHTCNGPGTSTEDFLAGLKQYVENYSPYSIRSLKYEGWNRHSKEFDNGHAAPELDWIKNGIHDSRCEWLNIGWYKIDKARGEMSRESGHWVCLVGYGIGIDGLSDPAVLIVRDPDPILGDEARKIFIKVEKIESDFSMKGPHYGLPRSSRGYLGIKSMGNGLDSSLNRHGIIDGAVVLELGPPGFASLK